MIIRLDDCPTQPWKNGLGSTREIAVHPPHADMDNFLWRVSIADVDSAAPFSRFPGIDRQIVLLDGAGFSMQLDDDRHHALTTPYEPFAFPGEAGVAVTLVDGPTRDFNLMVRRSHAHGLIRVETRPGSRLLAHDTVLLHCARGEVIIGHETLREGDSWLSTSKIPAGIVIPTHSIILEVCIQPVG